MKLVSDWKKAWKWFSVRFIALAAAVQVGLLGLPDAWRIYIPTNVMQVIVLVLLAAAILGRLVDQPKA